VTLPWLRLWTPTELVESKAGPLYQLWMVDMAAGCHRNDFPADSANRRDSPDGWTTRSAADDNGRGGRKPDGGIVVHMLRHHFQHLGKIHQPDERRIESLLLCRINERRARLPLIVL